MVMKALILAFIRRYGSWNTDEKFMLRIVSCPQPPLKFLEGREFTIVEVNAAFLFPRTISRRPEAYHFLWLICCWY